MKIKTDFERFFGGAFDMNNGAGLDNVVWNETQMFGQKEESDLDFVARISRSRKRNFPWPIVLHIAIEDFQ